MLSMKKDIQNRGDIELLVNSFYEKVKADPIIGYIFNDIAHVNWADHLPRMYDFWEHILFQTNSYAGNPMRVHEALNKRVALQPAHFTRWKELFLETVNDLFEGDMAELARQRALSIATVMQIKMHPPSTPNQSLL